TDFSDDTIGDPRRDETIHHQAPHARGPARIPPAGNHQQKQIAGEQRRRDYDLAAMAAALLAQQRLIDLVAGQREAVRRQAYAPCSNWRTSPIHAAPL